MLVVMIGVRKSLDCIFTRRELKILDDLMPEMSKRRSDDDLHQLDDENGAEVGIFKKFMTCCIGERVDDQKLHKVETVQK
jgi:solute carrier family 4 (sodium bicarbonate transporter), member 10